jgi:hypothetical protein
MRSDWDCIDPCALLILLLPHVKLQPKIAAAVQETLFNKGWIIPDTGAYDHDKVQREIKIHERRNNSTAG